MTAWADHVMWWHLYPLGFTGAPKRADGDGVVHRLDRIEGWLDHVVRLGLNGILLGPVFASETHGYDTVDHFRIDPRLGDDADFDRLVAACRSRGIRVLLDGVFNHVGRGHPAVRELARYDPDGRAEVFEGHDGLVKLNHDSPAVADLATRVMRHWLDRGIDGWRLDAAYAVDPAFWARVLPGVRERYPDAWFSGEVIHGDAAAIVRASGMDSLTQYELWQGIWHGLSDRNFFELAHALGRHDELLPTFVPSTFVGNHDVTRIASAVGPDLVPHAIAVLFTVAGVPSVYAGDEFGLTGVKEQREGGDDAIRPEFAARPPEDSSPILRAHQDLIALRRRNPGLVRTPSEVVHLTNTAIVIHTGPVVIALNIADTAATVPAAGATTLTCGSGTLRNDVIDLPPKGWAAAVS